MKKYFIKNWWMGMIFLLMLFSVDAQSERIDIKLVEYNADSGYSRIGISNIFPQDLTNIKISIGSSQGFEVVGLLKSGGTVYKVMNVPKGTHLIKVTSDEGLNGEKELLFASSKEQVNEKKQQEIKAAEEAKQRNLDLQKLARENSAQAQGEIAIEREKAIEIGALEKESNVIVILLIIGIVFGIGIVIWFIKKSGDAKA